VWKIKEIVFLMPLGELGGKLILNIKKVSRKGAKGHQENQPTE
jgi:hypothetical protein